MGDFFNNLLIIEYSFSIIAKHSVKIFFAVMLFIIITRIFKKWSGIMSSSCDTNPYIDQKLVDTVITVIRYILLFLFVVIILIMFGMDLSKLFATLGVTTLLLGMVLKDVVSNLLGGFVIFIYRPFQIGDVIEISGYKGSIISVNLRYTRMKSMDKKNEFMVPNSKLLQSILSIEKSK